MTIIPTFYILGEWFLGVIIMLYAIFPLIKLGVEKKPILTGVIVGVVYIYMQFFYNFELAAGYVFLTYTPYMYIGMVIVKYIKKIAWPVALGSLLIIILNWIFKPQIISGGIQQLYIGIASFFVLIFIAKWFEEINPIRKCCNFISKYSYAIFLTHHVIIAQAAARFNLEAFTLKDSVCLFLICCVLTIIASWLLFRLEKIIIGAFRPLIIRNKKSSKPLDSTAKTLKTKNS